MQEREVILTWEAIYDIFDIADYIEVNFGQLRADHFQTEIKNQIQSLKSISGIFGKTPIFYRGYSIYKKLFPPSIIFYIIKEQEVHILRVLREERNWKKILDEQQGYTYL